MTVPCETHRNILNGLKDLRSKGVISDETFAKASAETTAECEYAYHEGIDGNYRLRMP